MCIRDSLLWESFIQKTDAVKRENSRLHTHKLKPGSSSAIQVQKLSGEKINDSTSLYEILKRPKVLHAHLPQGTESLANNVIDEIEASVKYAGYIKRQQIDIERLQRNENTPIPKHIDYEQVVGLSNEVKQKLAEARPESLARASRLPGVTPAAISLLMVHLKRERRPVG